MNAVTKQEGQVLELAPVDSAPLAIQATPADNSPAGLMLALMGRGASLDQIERMTDFKELREALDAQAAHPEFEWGLWAIYPEMFVPDALDPTDIAYIAAANPAVIRSLLAELDAARKDAERWRTFIGLGYEIRAEWAANLSLAPVLTSWVDAAMKEQQP